ncbi:hypothetical protein NQ317_014103 [Molorchus minor]|uniref:Sphingomyelin phosphodiesterase C-terminal domain-containing protein n=1 Tax=Molorchus minor TaxID=1323400 RepID=A0ABQ9IUV4_9CUCU|nr:hypothetical protein NQ317_014103 [Molorchus minor]
MIKKKDVIDIDTYTFNLTDANLNPTKDPKWFKLYTMKDAYGLDKLSPENFNNVATEMFGNKTLFQLYWRFYVRDGDVSSEMGVTNSAKKKLYTESEAGVTVQTGPVLPTLGRISLVCHVEN